MAITDYDTLAAAIKVWAARSDATFSNQIETFISLTEDRLNNGQGDPGDSLYCPALNAPEMEVSATLNFVNGTADVPSDISTMRLLRVPDDDDGISYMTPKQWAERDAMPESATKPYYYTIEGGSIKVTPAYAGEIVCLYYKRFAGVRADRQTNAILTAYPNLYLSGCLFEAFSFMQDADLAAGHWARHKSMVSGINASIASIRFGGGPLRIRQRQPIP